MTMKNHTIHPIGSPGEKEKAEVLDPLSIFTPSGATTSGFLLPGCSNIIGIEEMQKQKEKKEIQKQRKREIDRRYRQNKNKAMIENQHKLAVTAIENEKLKSTVERLRQEIIQLTEQLELIVLEPMSTYVELEKEIKYLRIENEMAKCLLNNPNSTAIISNMIKALKENEELKRTMEHFQGGH